MKIAPAFSTGPLGQFSSHKSVFFLLFRRVSGRRGSNVEDDHNESKNQRASQQRHRKLDSSKRDKGARQKEICRPSAADRTNICEACAT